MAVGLDLTLDCALFMTDVDQKWKCARLNDSLDAVAAMSQGAPVGG